MFSYWERNHFSDYDTIIVGAGLSGLFTALNLKRKFPEEAILVLDKEMFPAASTKNAGFACMGSITELEDDLKNNSIKEIISLFEKRYKGLEIMRRTLGDANILYKENGSYELVAHQDEAILNRIDYWNSLLYPLRNKKAFTRNSINTRTFKGFSSMIKNELEGEIDTGKMYQTLKTKVQSMGVEVMTKMEVSNFEKEKDYHTIQLTNGFNLKTKRLILCTNAFTKDLISESDINPARSQVLITKPISNLSFKGIYHFDRGYYYFREIDGRVLFGGGRQLDELGETTFDLGSNDTILDDLKKKLREQILPNTSFEVDYTWSGIMGKAFSKHPISKQIEHNLFVLAGFGGMGVALTPYMAKELVAEIN